MTHPQLHWTEDGQPCSARWRSERGADPPVRVVLADDTMPADTAYRLACEGTALLWRGDFHNARQLMLALARRVDRPPHHKQRGKQRGKPAPVLAPGDPAAFHRHRQAQAQRARVLGAVLIGLDAAHGIGLRRAPDVRAAIADAWGAPVPGDGPSVVSLRELQGLVGAHEWRLKGVAVPALGDRIHPHYGVFSPQRGEYVYLVDSAPLPPGCTDAGGLAIDVGTGSGVLAALLARRGVTHVLATDLDPRALACAADNLGRLGLTDRVTLLQADLYPPEPVPPAAPLAQLIVCNPPWLPARPSAPIERAVYDEDGRMLKGFLAGLAARLAPGGEGWLILSDLAEHLGLRTRAELLAAFGAAGLRVVGRLDARPRHPKADDSSDALHVARAAETTSLWRLAAAPDTTA